MEIKSNYIPHNFRNKYLKNVGGSYSSTVLQPTVSGEAGTKVVVIDDLETSSKDKALSANMGKYLNENKQDKNEYVDTINQYLSTDSDVKFNSVAGKNGEFDNLKDQSEEWTLTNYILFSMPLSQYMKKQEIKKH